MCEVTKENYEKIYPKVLNDLENSTFVAIDCEFSGLHDFGDQCSLFDTPKSRFRKLQTRMDNFQIIQFGLSTFKYSRDNNSFTASSYSFYLKPGNGLGNEKLIFLLSSLDFLCRHNFDFNKVIYNGISYLNKAHESAVLTLIKEGNYMTVESRDEIQKYCSRVAEWSAGVKEGEEMVLETEGETKTFVYVLHQEIRKKMYNCWTYIRDDVDDVVVRKVSQADKAALELNKREEFQLKKKLLDSVLGFSRVLKEIQNLKKPIVGHNLFLDLLFIYKQFYNPGRVTYKRFKKDITTLFPRVYDTKAISYRLKDIVAKDLQWNSNRLLDLYFYLKKGKGATLVLFAPSVSHKSEKFATEENFHEAGFDSYCTGFCFLTMAHVFARWNQKEKKFTTTFMPMTSAWLLGSVKEMENHVNMSRSRVRHIVLNGDDPASLSFRFLYVKSKTTQPLDVVKIKNLISKYGSIDVQLLHSHGGVLAVTNQKQARDILSKFKNHEDFEITEYNFFKHSEIGRILVSGALIASVVVMAVITTRGWLKL